MPALNAARTALICPRVNETVATSNSPGWEDLSPRETFIRLIPRGQSTSAPRLLETCRNQQVQFVVRQVLDGTGQVLR